MSERQDRQTTHLTSWQAGNSVTSPDNVSGDYPFDTVGTGGSTVTRPHTPSTPFDTPTDQRRRVSRRHVAYALLAGVCWLVVSLLSLGLLLQSGRAYLGYGHYLSSWRPAQNVQYLLSLVIALLPALAGCLAIRLRGRRRALGVWPALTELAVGLVYLLLILVGLTDPGQRTGLLLFPLATWAEPHNIVVFGLPVLIALLLIAQARSSSELVQTLMIVIMVICLLAFVLVFGLGFLGLLVRGWVEPLQVVETVQLWVSLAAPLLFSLSLNRVE